MTYTNLATHRLILKNVSLEDRDFLYELYSGTSNYLRLFNMQPIESLEDAACIIQKCMEHNNMSCCNLWVIIRKDNGKKIGICGFRDWDEQSGSVEVDCDLHPNARGKGFMFEALQELTTFARQQMQLRKIRAHIFAHNLASLSIAKKLGFFQTGQETSQYLDQEFTMLVYELDLKGLS